MILLRTDADYAEASRLWVEAMTGTFDACDLPHLHAVPCSAPVCSRCQPEEPAEASIRQTVQEHARREQVFTERLTARIRAWKALVWDAVTPK